MQIIVRDNNVEQALRALKKKLQREGVYREMKLRRHFETESGLQFRTIKPGTGEPITRQDAALLDYILTADDGTVIDASQQPAPFTMDQVYPGFAEAMSRMREGGEYRFSMPQKLAFVNS